MKLAQENEKLRAELKGMTDRLEAAERKRQEMAKIQEEEEQRHRDEDAARQAATAAERASSLEGNLDEAAMHEQESGVLEEDPHELGAPS